MPNLSELKVLLRGGGEMASAVAHTLWRCHIRQICITEKAQPTAIRRLVCFSEAVYDDEKTIEGVTAELLGCHGQIKVRWADGLIPVFVDPDTHIKAEIRPDVLIDATLAKRPGEIHIFDAPLVIALGPGFYAGRDAHVVVETNRGHHLGRVIEKGETEADTGVPGDLAGVTSQRVLRSPGDGTLLAERQLKDRVTVGERLASVQGVPLHSEIAGVLRGLIRPGIAVVAHQKIGDVDPRGEPAYCDTISDKALAIAGGVLQAILMRYNR